MYAPGDIVDLTSTSDVFIPPRGNSLMKCSFDFPERGVVFGGHRFSVLLFTEENTHALDRTLMRASGTADAECRGVTHTAAALQIARGDSGSLITGSLVPRPSPRARPIH